MKTVKGEADRIAMGAAAEQWVLDHPGRFPEIRNAQAREITGITSEGRMKGVFYRLRKRGLIELVEGRARNMAAWRLTEPGRTDELGA